MKNWFFSARGTNKGDEKSEKRSVKSYKSDDEKYAAEYQLDTAVAKVWNLYPPLINSLLSRFLIHSLDIEYL